MQRNIRLAQNLLTGNGSHRGRRTARAYARSLTSSTRLIARSSKADRLLICLVLFCF